MHNDEFVYHIVPKRNSGKSPKSRPSVVYDKEKIHKLYSQFILDENKNPVALKCEPYCSNVISHKNYNFIIMERPTTSNLPELIEYLMNKGVKYIFKCSHDSFTPPVFEELGITTIDMPFPDGRFPDQELIQRWLQKVNEITEKYPGSPIAIHCIAGLGRAPVLISIALMEAGMEFEDAVAYVRHERRGAMNVRQLEELEKYEPSFRSETEKTDFVYKYYVKILLICGVNKLIHKIRELIQEHKETERKFNIMSDKLLAIMMQNPKLSLMLKGHEIIESIRKEGLILEDEEYELFRKVMGKTVDKVEQEPQEKTDKEAKNELIENDKIIAEIDDMIPETEL